jgi:hypothetical protein
MEQVIIELVILKKNEQISRFSLLSKVSDKHNSQSIETAVTNIINANKENEDWIGGNVINVKVRDIKMPNHYYYVRYLPTNFDYLLAS